jgi:hypothetical protein
MGGDLVFDSTSQSRYLARNRWQYLIEPALTVRGGLGFLKAEAQIGRSFNVWNGNFPQDDGWASLGLVYSFNPP